MDGGNNGNCNACKEVFVTKGRNYGRRRSSLIATENAYKTFFMVSPNGFTCDSCVSSFKQMEREKNLMTQEAKTNTAGYVRLLNIYG